MRLSGAGQHALRFVAGADITERTAALVSTVSVGRSFGPGLLPRSGLDQALVTGVVAAIEYGLVVTSQSLFGGLARFVLRDDDPAAGRARRFLAQAATDTALAVTGRAVERLLPPRPDELLRRAFVRTVGRRTASVGSAGLVVAAIAAVDELPARDASRPLRALVAASGLGVGAVVSARQIRSFRDEADLRPLGAVDPLAAADGGLSAAALAPHPPLLSSLIIGVAVSAGLQGLAAAEGAIAHRVGAGVRAISPAAEPMSVAAGHAVAFAALGAAVVVAVDYLNRKADAGGAAIDAAYAAAPQSTTVSGGPASELPWASLSREGMRFVNMALTPHEIVEATGAAHEHVKPPVRVFVGLASAPMVDTRVTLAMEELERLGAFERSVLCIASPTGTGYVNYVAVETLEYLTRGDCATVALQYSLRPSFLSLDRVRMGREQNRALLHALAWRLRGVPEEKRPRLVAFGESLGAYTLQDAFLHEGVAGLHRAGVDRAVFVGTPAASKWAAQWRLHPSRTDPENEVVEVESYEDWLTRDPQRHARHSYVLLSRHEDPITRFEPALAVQQPPWLGPVAQRPPSLPRKATWYPLTTFLLTVVDIKNSMDVVPGTFVARGHDYRAALPRIVSAAYDLPVGDDELLSIERALRWRERTWAEQRLLAEQLHRAGEAVQRQLSAWGLAEIGERS